MTAVSAMYARKQIEQAINLPDKAPLYQIIEMTPDQLQDGAVMVPIAAYLSLIEAIAQSEWPDLRFHMRTSQSMRCDEFGVFGLAFKSAPTVRQGLQRLQQYVRLHNRVSEFAAEAEGGAYVWSMKGPAVVRLGSALSAEAAMATTLVLCREATQKTLTPVKVEFSHTREGSKDALMAHFGVMPEFGAARDAIHFDMAEVEQPCAVGDAAIWQYLTTHLDQALQEDARRARPFAELVIEEITKLLSGGVPQLAEVAGIMGLGERTFQRRLSEQGQTFQALVDEARHQLARQLVVASSYSLIEITFLTGFSEQSAFSRGFKRWTGMSPRAYRQAQKGESLGAPASR
ncbi:AraC family transcriptional regulator [Shimia sp. MMG029]|uniref:AraC family transcriptional regulator n=1 Tax=Shimia sp. MMG029 TaxID=3021978 RepID=UPI0022FE2B7A|nr:AraC family transcriptional regulator [Shimia sp. MMG029]MDA5556588.1 AraC family transcriptional regulator ligand-binding domain-containing protein [Shimia sp. MMG029]